MTMATPGGDRRPQGRVESLRVAVARIGFACTVVLLAVGLGLWLAGYRDASGVSLAAAVGLLVAMPVTGVIALLVEELTRREWVFAGAAALVLLLLAYNLGRVWLALG
jgi:hypothetical protein